MHSSNFSFYFYNGLRRALVLKGSFFTETPVFCFIDIKKNEISIMQQRSQEYLRININKAVSDTTVTCPQN